VTSIAHVAGVAFADPRPRDATTAPIEVLPDQARMRVIVGNGAVEEGERPLLAGDSLHQPAADLRTVARLLMASAYAP
jgi:hypothetical protein